MKILIKDTDALKILILRSGYTKRGFGRALGISESYAIQIINGTRNAGPEIAKNMSDLLEVEFDDIFFIENACKSGQKSTA